MTEKTAEPAPIVYLEIPAPQLEKAGAFYTSVFGWKMTSSGEYMMFDAGDDSLGGGLDPKKPVADGGVIIYIKVADIPATLKAIELAGGTKVRDKSEIGDGWGYFALFKDPNGNRLGLWSKS